MNLIKSPFRWLCLAAVALCSPVIPQVSADTMYVWAEEIAGSVVFYHQGSIDVTAFSPSSTISAGTSITPSNPTFVNGEDPSVMTTYYTGVIAINPMFGNGGQTDATSEAGDTFGFAGSGIVLPNGYMSGTAISGSMTFSPATFLSLEVDTTPYSIEVAGSNTIRMFTRPPVSVPVDNSAAEADLLKQVSKLQKKIKKLKKKGKKAKAKKLGKKVKKLKQQLLSLG